MPVYRFSRPFGGDYQYRFSRASSIDGWTNNGIAFHAYSTNAPGRIAVYQYLAANVEGLFDARRQLVAWASHDLRAPLASMQAMIAR